MRDFERESILATRISWPWDAVVCVYVYVCVCMCVYACVRVHVWLKSNCNSQGWVDRGGSQPKGDVSLPCFLFR